MNEQQETCAAAPETTAPSPKKRKSPLAHENLEPANAALLQRMERIAYALENVEAALLQVAEKAEALFNSMTLPQPTVIAEYSLEEAVKTAEEVLEER